MNSEQAAYACASQRHHRFMNFGKKQRYIEVFQCSGDDMNLVLTGAPLPGKALLSPGSLASAASTPVAPVQAPVPVPTHTPQPAAPIWDIHAFVQAQAQAQVQAQAVQAQAVQAQAMRNQDFWLMALASNGVANPAASVAPTAAPNPTSKALALPSTVPQHAQFHHHHHPHHATLPQIAAYSHEQQQQQQQQHHHHQLHAQAVAQQHAVAAAANSAPLLFFNMPQPHRIPILRAAAPPSFISSSHLIPGAPINHTATLLGLKRSWESAFPTETAASAPKRATWQSPAAAFHASAQTAPPPALAYPTQFFPQI